MAAWAREGKLEEPEYAAVDVCAVYARTQTHTHAQPGGEPLPPTPRGHRASGRDWSSKRDTVSFSTQSLTRNVPRPRLKFSAPLRERRPWRSV